MAFLKEGNILHLSHDPEAERIQNPNLVL